MSSFGCVAIVEMLNGVKKHLLHVKQGCKGGKLFNRRYYGTFRHVSPLMERNSLCSEEGLADFLGAFDVGDLEEALG